MVEPTERVARTNCKVYPRNDKLIEDIKGKFAISTGTKLSTNKILNMCIEWTWFCAFAHLPGGKTVHELHHEYMKVSESDHTFYMNMMNVFIDEGYMALTKEANAHNPHKD